MLRVIFWILIFKQVWSIWALVVILEIKKCFGAFHFSGLDNSREQSWKPRNANKNYLVSKKHCFSKKSYSCSWSSILFMSFWSFKKAFSSFGSPKRRMELQKWFLISKLSKGLIQNGSNGRWSSLLSRSFFLFMFWLNSFAIHGAWFNYTSLLEGIQTSFTH